MYELSEKDAKQIDNNFIDHAPRGNQAERYAEIRANAKDFALYLGAVCPASRELSLALTNLEQAVMWANAAIARNERA